MTLTAPHGRGETHQGDIIAADVLDAWFEPSPSVLEAFQESVTLIRTSPDPACTPLIQAISALRAIPFESISLGAGSSEIIHRVLPGLANNGPAVILDPTYSEYAFVLERIGCPIIRHPLKPENDFQLSIDELVETAKHASLVILVNPNNPTGQALTAEQVMELRGRLDPTTVLWVDEAYIDYAPAESSIEIFAADLPNLYVLKSLSKAYALSGVRVAYLVGYSRVPSPPPWIVSNPAMAAAVEALCDQSYYQLKWRETNAMTREFADLVRAFGLTVYDGHLNAILIESPKPNWANDLAENGLIVRTPRGMGEVLGDQFVRIGLQPRSQWPAMLHAIGSASPGTARNDDITSLVLYS